jgi:hypothetical protein
VRTSPVEHRQVGTFGADWRADRTLKEICRDKPPGWKVWQAELSMFTGWGDKHEDKEKAEGNK